MYSERYEYVTDVKLDSTVVLLDRIWGLFILEESYYYNQPIVSLLNL